MGLGALLIIGIVYTILGGVFVTLGIVLAVALWNTEEKMIGLIFGGIGSIFLVLGIVFLIIEIRKKRRADRILAEGRYVWGEIVDCVPNFNVRINGRHPYIAVARYTDPRGMSHVFKSRSLNIYREPDMIGKQVKIYYDNDSFKYYYIDMDGVLPNFIEH